MQNKPTKRKFDNVEQVYGYAMSLLNYRDYSSKDMFQKLTAKGAKPADANEAIAKMLEHNFINEERYAKQVFRAWLSKKDCGKRSLYMELHRKNVSEECIPEIMESFTDEMEEANAQVAIRYFIKHKYRKDKYTRESILAAGARFMTNRGFGSRYIQVLLDMLRNDDDI